MPSFSFNLQKCNFISNGSLKLIGTGGTTSFQNNTVIEGLVVEPMTSSNISNYSARIGFNNFPISLSLSNISFYSAGVIDLTLAKGCGHIYISNGIGNTINKMSNLSSKYPTRFYATSGIGSTNVDFQNTAIGATTSGDLVSSSGGTLDTINYNAIASDYIEYIGVGTINERVLIQNFI